MTAASWGWRAFGLAWTALVVALVAHQVWLWSGGLVVDTDVLALLPKTEQDPVAALAMRRLADQGTRRVVVAVGAADFEAARRGAEALAVALAPVAKRVDASVETTGDALVQALTPFREGLLTDEDRARLAQADGPALVTQALALLQQPVGRRLGAFRDDPLGFFGHFLEARAGSTRLRPREGALWTEADGLQWVLVQLETTAPAFAFDGSARFEPALERAREAARREGASRVLAAGVPRFAETAAVQANWEVSTVGLGSMLAILVVMWLAFRSLRPLLLVAATVGLGVAAGLSACALVFGRVHLVTLVFGAGLVGVAEDYGIHYFANRQAAPGQDRGALLWHHLPGLTLALATSIAGYGMLAVTPFPGLRQVALYSAVGLVAAFAGVVAWFPFLDRGEVRMTRFSARWMASRARWPVVRGARAVIAGVVLVVVTAAGFWRLHFEDDVRELTGVPQALLDEQLQLARLIGLPSPAQCFVVHGADEAEVLTREEALRATLAPLVSAGVFDGYEAVSAWVPSPARQRADRAAVLAAKAAIERGLADELEGPAPTPREDWRPLSVADLRQTPVGAQLGALWVDAAEGGPASVVMLRGLGKAGLERLAALDAPTAGVRFVDRTGELSRVMGRYRQDMLWLLIGGYALVFAALFARYRRRAWRALLPTLIASVLALVVAALAGEKIQLFHVLGLWLLLGMGVDYGIFLLEHPSRQAGEAWLAVGLGAVSTLLSFGLLALSKTPAIHAFGLAMAVGIAAVWALSPLFCDEA